MFIMKSGTRHMTEGIELPNQGKIRTHGEKETYKYSGNIGTPDIVTNGLIQGHEDLEISRRVETI